MAIINNVTMFVLIIASTIVILVFFLKELCTNREKANLKVSNQETQDKDKPKPSTADISNANNPNDNIQTKIENKAEAKTPADGENWNEGDKEAEKSNLGNSWDNIQNKDEEEIY